MNGIQFLLGLKAKGTDKVKKNMADLLNQQRKASKETKAYGKVINETFNSTKVIAFASTIKGITQAMINQAQAQITYSDSVNKLKVAYGDTADEALNLIDKMSTMTGFDAAVFTKYAANYRQMASALGITGEAADNLSNSLVALQTDVQALNKEFSLDEIGTKIQSALAGESEAVRKLGADVTMTALQQEAYNRGIDKQVSEMTRAEKAILTYLALQTQMQNAQGQTAQQINGVSQQVKIFKDQITIAARQLGAVFIPVLQAILPVINGVIMAFNTLMGMFLSLIGADTKSLTKGTKNISAGIGGLGDALDKTKDSADAAKKSLRGFDKLNVITTPSKGKDTSASIGGGVDQSFLDALNQSNYALEEMRNKAAEIRDSILKWLGFTKDVNGQWKWSGKTLLKNIWEWWKDLNTLGKIFVGIGIAKVLTNIFKNGLALANLLKDKLNPRWKAFKDVVKLAKEENTNMLDTFFQTRTAAERVIGALTGITMAAGGLLGIYDAISDIKNGVADFDTVLQIIISTLSLVGGAILTVGSIMGGMTTTMALATGGISLLVGALAGLVAWVMTSSNETDKYTESLNKLSDAAKEEVNSGEAQIARNKELVKELGALMDSNGKVQKGYENRASFILTKLNEAYGTEYKLVDGMIYNNDKLVGTYDNIKDAIYRVMDAKRADNILNAYQETYNQALKNGNEILKEANKISEKKGELSAKENKKLKELKKQYDKNHETIINYENLQKAVYEGNVDDMQKYAKKFYDDSNTNIETAFSGIERYTKETADKVKKTLSTNVTTNASQDGKEWANAFAKSANSTLSSKKVKINAQSGTISIQTRAEGGFVNRGDFFLANENGKPEYVGSMGGRTAVANNDQITSGIRQAAKEGFLDAMSLTGNKNVNVNISAEGDASGLLNFINFKQKERDRQFGM